MTLLTEPNVLKIPENKFLWDKIRHFRFNEPGAVITFAGKLAVENTWTEQFTKRVIEEYRKFIFLCCIAPGGASPSKIVDDAWHLHLTYTRSYWVDLCKNILGKDLHHNPSKGGEDEKHKYETLYKDTLRLYKQVFGETPPEDIWPRPEDAFVKLDVPEFSLDSRKLLWIGILLGFPFVFILLNEQTVFPYHLNGPQFLRFYGLLAVAAAISFFLVQKQKVLFMESAVQDHFPDNISIFQITRFLFGKHLAIQTGIVDLVNNSLLNVTNEKKFRVSSNRDYVRHADKNPFTPLLLSEEEGKELSYEEIAASWYSEEKFSHPVLDRIAELAEGNEPFIRRFYLPAAVLFLGVARVVQGWVNDEPAGFLVMEIIFFSMSILIIYSTLSLKGAIAKKVHSLYREKLMCSGQDEHTLAADFALSGHSVIMRAAEGILLISIFEAYTSHQRPEPGSGSGGGGCSGDSSCGGGCGGCGGGD